MNRLLAGLTCLSITVLPLIARSGEEVGRQVPSSEGSTEAVQFGYDSPEAALSALRQRQDVRIYEQGGWTIADDRPNLTLWSFTPPDHPAHPAAIKRVLVQSATGGISVVMTAKCGGPKTACDKLIAEFQALNAGMRNKVQAEIKGR